MKNDTLSDLISLIPIGYRVRIPSDCGEVEVYNTTRGPRVRREVEKFYHRTYRLTQAGCPNINITLLRKHIKTKAWTPTV